MKNFITLLSLILLTSCGYESLYRRSSYKDVIGFTSQISIPPVKGNDGRHGQYLRNELYTSLTPYGETTNGKYVLEIKLNQPSITEQGIREDDTATFVSVRVSANYKLKDIQTDEVLLEDSSIASSSYNILSEVYASDVSKEDANLRAIKVLSENISRRIAVYYKSR